MVYHNFAIHQNLRRSKFSKICPNMGSQRVTKTFFKILKLRYQNPKIHQNWLSSPKFWRKFLKRELPNFGDDPRCWSIWIPAVAFPSLSQNNSSTCFKCAVKIGNNLVFKKRITKFQKTRCRKHPEQMAYDDYFQISEASLETVEMAAKFEPRWKTCHFSKLLYFKIIKSKFFLWQICPDYDR